MFTLLYKPTNQVCEVENGVCYEVHSTIEAAQNAILEMDSHLHGDYEVIALPSDLKPYIDSETLTAKVKADMQSTGIFIKAVGLGFSLEQAQMLCNAAHEISIYGEQKELQLLSQFS